MIKKAIVNGASYTPDQAIAEAQKIWDKYNGKKIDEFYKKWYADNKDTALMPEDIFDIVDDQRVTQEEILE